MSLSICPRCEEQFLDDATNVCSNCGYSKEDETQNDPDETAYVNNDDDPRDDQ